MKFESIKIKNFRNFEEIELTLSNKNIFFGLNDVGKTNFLYALRYVFDKDIRKLNLVDSDFHKPIEIIVSLDISDVEDIDCQKLRAQLKGALQSKHSKVYIKLLNCMILVISYTLENQNKRWEAIRDLLY